MPATTLNGSFLKNIPSASLRSDGRLLNEHRHLKFSRLNPGAHLCQMNNTKVIAQVVSQLATPPPGRLNEGSLLISVSFSVDSNKAHYKDRVAKENDLLHLLESVYRRQNILDQEELCLIPGRLAWAIRLSVEVLGDDGNVAGCSLMAIAEAMKSFVRPHVELSNGALVRICSLEEKPPLHLKLHSVPLVTTIVLLGEENEILIDPLLEEEEMSNAICVAAMDSADRLCYFSLKGTEVKVGRDIVNIMTDLAANTARSLRAIIKENK